MVIQTVETVSTREATERLVKIFDSTYVKARLKQVADNATQMNAYERTQLPRLLEGVEDLFYSTIGDWDTEPVDMELNPDYKLFNCKYYPVNRIINDNFSKYPKLLLKIVVLTLVQQSHYGTPVLIIPRKEGTVRFIMDYHRLNHKLVIKPYPLTIIGEKIYHLEGFRNLTALYLNMGYYNIRLLPASQDITKIITEFGKFKYNHLPMGMCASEDIFQDKLVEMHADIEGVKTYIGDILVLIKERFSKHIEALRIIFGRFQISGLTLNASNFSFRLK